MWCGRLIGRIVCAAAAVWAVTATGGVVRADEGVVLLSLQEPSVARYARLIQPVMVETLLVVRQPVDIGRHRELDQRGQVVWLAALLERVRAIEPPPSAVETHRLILNGLERFLAGVRLRLEGQTAAAEGQIAEAQRVFEEAARLLQVITPTALPVGAVGGER